MKFFGMRFDDYFNYHDVYTDDLCKSSYTENPTIVPEIDLVYVLSGRTTALGTDADGLKREFDHSDDIDRLCEGIRIATIINALRANKKVEELAIEDYVTPIFYNGRTIHNKDLKIALQRNLLPYYPRELFIIYSINPENTIGQIQSFNKYLSNHYHENVAVVSSAYHLPRVARTIGLDSPQVTNENVLLESINSPFEKLVDSPLSTIKLFLFGVHKNEKRPGMIFDLTGEHSAMQRYYSGTTPSISKYSSNNVFFTNEDYYIYKSFLRALFWDKRITESEEKKSINDFAIVPYGRK